MPSYPKSTQLSSEKKGKKGGFGDKPSNGNFGKKPSRGNFGKKPSNGTFGKKAYPSGKSSRNKITRSEIELEAQKVFNTYIRERDNHLPCVSCGVTKAEFHAGHFKSVGSRKDLRFDERNCHKQCRHCNIELVGNPKGYRVGILSRISREDLEVLDMNVIASPKSTLELVEILQRYRGRTTKGEKMEKKVRDKIFDVLRDIERHGIKQVVKDGVILSHSTEENKANSGVDVLVHLSPEIRIDTLKKIVYGFHEGTVLSKAYPTC